ncbi:unnamed protein product [Protopolystoma xenopodis]|uniref:Uncharacterized protein n=1 Tax=Protopolystoma xenopodis TaxID=117903 RepID=A0A3S4ZNF1_9PLAT|nr:unnamed protein product [Protopolystoma xenopodis]
MHISAVHKVIREQYARLEDTRNSLSQSLAVASSPSSVVHSQTELKKNLSFNEMSSELLDSRDLEHLSRVNAELGPMLKARRELTGMLICHRKVNFIGHVNSRCVFYFCKA